MTTSVENLQPASKADYVTYIPYFPGNKRQLLPLAMTLYQQASLEGKRKIEGGESIPFVATWNTTKLPSDQTQCRLQFDGNAELSYEIAMENSQFVEYLIELLMNNKRSRSTDFSQAFYRKLLGQSENK